MLVFILVVAARSFAEEAEVDEEAEVAAEIEDNNNEIEVRSVVWGHHASLAMS